MPVSSSSHALEIGTGKRFSFGANWRRFLSTLNESRITEAQRSLRTMLGCQSLAGRKFLDVGSGSGLFSLAAHQLGATVHSFDYDPQSVACTKEVRRRYANGENSWVVEEGSILDSNYVQALGRFDVVYSWGVLHHTGQMLKAFESAASLVAPGGQLFIAIYGDNGWKSRYWTAVKRQYNKGPVRKFLLTTLHIPYSIMLPFIVELLSGQPVLERGMSRWHDYVDWLGGYPFEVAKPEEVFEFFAARGFILRKLKTRPGGACNDFVFEKTDTI